jgi:hypothetical protein
MLLSGHSLCFGFCDQLRMGVPDFRIGACGDQLWCPGDYLSHGTSLDMACDAVIFSDEECVVSSVL